MATKTKTAPNSALDFDEYRRSILQKAGLAAQIWESPKKPPPLPPPQLNSEENHRNEQTFNEKRTHFEEKLQNFDEKDGKRPIPDEKLKTRKNEVIGELQHSFSLLNGQTSGDSPQETMEFIKISEATRKSGPPPPPKIKPPAPLPQSVYKQKTEPKPTQVNGFSPKKTPPEIPKRPPPEVPKKPSGNRKILASENFQNLATTPADEFKAKNAYQRYIESFTHEPARSTVRDFAENRFIVEETRPSTLPRPSSKKAPPKVLPKPTKAKVLESANWPPGETDTDFPFGNRSGLVPGVDNSMGNQPGRPADSLLVEKNWEQNQQKSGPLGGGGKNTTTVMPASSETAQENNCNDEEEPKRPTQREIEKRRREAVREQMPRTEARLKQWNINDISPDSDFLPPKTRIQTLRRLSDEKDDSERRAMHQALDLNTELVHKKREGYETGQIFEKSEARLREAQGFWPGQEEGKLTSPIPGNARNIWEHRIQQHNDWLNEQKQQVPDSRRWKSLDALSASLLGTHIRDPWEVQAQIFRRNVHQTEKPAFNPEIKDPLFRMPVNYLQKAHTQRSMEHLEMNGKSAGYSTGHGEPTPLVLDGPNWYDQYRMRDAISHESIGDLGQTKHMWERRVEESLGGMTSPQLSGNYEQQQSPQQRGGSYQAHTLPYTSSGVHHSVHFPSEHRMVASSTAHVMHANNPSYNGHAHSQSYNGEFTGRNQNVIEQDISQYRVRENELHNRQMLSPLMVSGGNRRDHGQINREKELLLIYLNTRPEVVQELGLILPQPMKQKFRSLGPHLPMVELREAGGNGSSRGYGQRNSAQQSPVMRKGDSAGMNGYGHHNGHTNQNGFATYYGGYIQGSRGSSMERSASMERTGTMGSAGRYIKNTQPSSRKIVVRKPSMEAGLGPPSTRHFVPPVERSSADAEDEDIEGMSPGESLIAREIRESKEKEYDLRRSRSELGLPTLEDTLEIWRQSEGAYQSPIPLLRGAQSYDHLHQAVNQEGSFSTLPRSQRNNMPAPGAGGMNLPFKAGSLDHIHQSVMNSTEDTADGGFTSVGKVAPPRNKRGQYEAYLQAHHPSKSQTPDFPVATGTGAGGGGGSGSKRPVPVESRIEQEVADLKMREAEIRQYRELYSPSMSQPKSVDIVENGTAFSEQDERASMKSEQSSEELKDVAGGDGSSRSGEYVSEKFRSFKFVESGETYNFPSGDLADEMILVSDGRSSKNSWIGHRS